MCQVMCETEGFDVFLDARRYNPLVSPELVSLQIRPYRREELQNLHEFWVCDFGNRLAIFGPFGHDAVEVKDELLGEVCYISTGLSRGNGGATATMGQVMVERELCC